MITPAAVGCKRMILIQPSPCAYQLDRLSAGTRAHAAQEEDRMRVYNRRHRHYCGIDLHVKTMYICILDSAGQPLVHRNVKSTPGAFLEVVTPYRADLVVAAECMFAWYWLADVCAAEGSPSVLGHALAMKAIHGGKAQNDKIDSHKIAGLLRGGLLPGPTCIRRRCDRRGICSVGVCTWFASAANS